MASAQTSVLSGTAIPQIQAATVTPNSITLNSSAASRKIELSTNNGVEFFTPQYDVTSTTMLIVVVTSPITHYRLTGNQGDTYVVS